MLDLVPMAVRCMCFTLLFCIDMTKLRVNKFSFGYKFKARWGCFSQPSANKRLACIDERQRNLYDRLSDRRNCNVNSLILIAIFSC